MKDSQDIATLMEVEVAYGDEVPEILVMYKPCNWSLRQKKEKRYEWKTGESSFP